MHRLEDQDSFQLFGNILSLNERQKIYVRSLGQGSVVVRGHNSHPIFVKVGNYLDRFQTLEDDPIIDDSDESLKDFMQHKEVVIPSAELWEPKRNQKQKLILISEQSEVFLNSIQETIQLEQWDKLKKQISNWCNPTNLQIVKQIVCEDIVKQLNCSDSQAEIIHSLFRQK